MITTPRMIHKKVLSIITDKIKLLVVEETVAEIIVVVVETAISAQIMTDQATTRRVSTALRTVISRVTEEIALTAMITVEVVANNNADLKRKEQTITKKKKKLPLTGIEELTLPSSLTPANKISNQTVTDISNPR